MQLLEREVVPYVACDQFSAGVQLPCPSLGAKFDNERWGGVAFRRAPDGAPAELVMVMSQPSPFSVPLARVVKLCWIILIVLWQAADPAPITSRSCHDDN